MLDGSERKGFLQRMDSRKPFAFTEFQTEGRKDNPFDNGAAAELGDTVLGQISVTNSATRHKKLRRQVYRRKLAIASRSSAEQHT
jgi:hypothetical protein